jgi:anti-sigma factor RsiW
MMDYQTQLKLQAYLDGELTGHEAREFSDWLARDGEATKLATELRQTGEALKGFEESIKLPESREFYWSKIQREIARGEGPANRVQTPWLTRLQRFLVPAAAVAVLGVAGLLAMPRSAAPFETYLADAGTFTYHDYSAATTLVWLTYPAENDVADSNEAGTLD